MRFVSRGSEALVLAAIVLAAPAARAQTEPLPTIVTYELRKARLEGRIAAANPKGFWLKQVAARIEDRVVKTPLRLPQPVTVQMSFVIAHDGHLVSQAVARSSGVEAADKAAEQMIASAAPFPAMPEVMTDSQLAFSLPVRFR